MANPTTVATNRQPTSTAPHAITSPRPAVSQTTLAEILKRRREVKEADKSLKALKDALAERERAHPVQGRSDLVAARTCTIAKARLRDLLQTSGFDPGVDRAEQLGHAPLAVAQRA